MWLDIYADFKTPVLANVDIPEGCYVVRSGAVKPGDRYLNAVLISDGIQSWESACPAKKPYTQAHFYLCLVRVGVPPGGPQTRHVCELWEERRGEGCHGRCQPGEIFCPPCLEMMRQQIAAQGY